MIDKISAAFNSVITGDESWSATLLSGESGGVRNGLYGRLFPLRFFTGTFPVLDSGAGPIFRGRGCTVAGDDGPVFKGGEIHVRIAGLAIRKSDSPPTTCGLPMRIGGCPMCIRGCSIRTGGCPICIGGSPIPIELAIRIGWFGGCPTCIGARCGGYPASDICGSAALTGGGFRPVCANISSNIFWVRRRWLISTSSGCLAGAQAFAVAGFCLGSCKPTRRAAGILFPPDVAGTLALLVSVSGIISIGFTDA
jgi:hypothetical protein